MRRMRFLTLIVIVILLLAFRGSTGSAQEPGPGQGVLTVQDTDQQVAPLGQVNIMADPPASGQAFVCLGPESFQPYFRTSTLDRNGTLMIRPLTPAGSSAPLDAPLILPQGAEVKQIVAYFMDNDTTYNVQLLFAVHAHTASMGYTSDVIASTGASSSIRYIALTNLSSYRKIDLLTYSYLIRIDMVGGANTYLNNVRIDYSFNLSLPAVTR